MEENLADFEIAADESFNKLFDNAFIHAEQSGLFGGDFKEYMKSRNQYSDKHFQNEYNDLRRKYKNFLKLMIDDLRDCDNI